MDYCAADVAASILGRRFCIYPHRITEWCEKYKVSAVGLQRDMVEGKVNHENLLTALIQDEPMRGDLC